MNYKSIIKNTLTALIVLLVCLSDATEIPPDKMKAYSYALGTSMGQGLRQQQINLDVDAFTRGVKDALAGTTAISEQQIRDTLAEFQQSMQEIMTAKLQALGAENAEKGNKFMAENAKKQGIVTTASGLQYKIENPGTGPKPSPTDVVSVQYRGMLIDGREFESSYSRGQPATLPLSNVIEGLKQGILLIGKGGKIRLFIPPHLAYGETGAAPAIGPNSTLIFDVELVDILPSSENSNN